MKFPGGVRIREVGPRDGIQSERATVSTADKVKLIDLLARAGLRYIEAVSFVSPKAIPNMADAEEVYRGIERLPGVVYSALVPNRRGAETAARVGVDAMQVFIAATDSYNLRNVRRTVEESWADVAAVAEVGRSSGIPVAGTISTAFGCPYEGDVAPGRVVELTRRMVDLGITSVSYGDTTGMATPRRVSELLEALCEELPEVEINLHFHDTRGTALANVVTAMAMGVDFFDASVGGMGGSPYAAGASGNLCTEDLVHMLIDMDIDTGVDFDALMNAARFAQDVISGPLPSRMLAAGPRWHTQGPVDPASVRR